VICRILNSGVWYLMVSPTLRLPVWILLAVWAVGVAAEATPEPVTVTLQPLSELLVYAEREAPAAAVSLNESRVAAEVSAVVREIPVQVGEVIEQGAVLVVLDPRDHELALQRAQAALQAAQARIKLAEFQLERTRELRKRNFASEDTLTQRETELDVLRAERAAAVAQLESARRDLAKCTLTAPFDAIVQARSAQVGELAAPGTPLLTLIDASRIEVSAQIQPDDSGSLETAGDIHFVTAGRSHPLRLLRISPAIDRGTRTREVRLSFIDQRAAPGSEGLIRWRAAAPLLPAELLSRRDGRLGVFVAADGVARFVVLDQAQEGRPAPVTLAPETPIILEGRFGLQDGDRINPRR
jgi:RND family efflux transporter MFP subunit